MIKTIEIENFKCLDQVNVPLSNLTVLSGLNGMGKSTFMQTLLLMHQSSQEVADPMSHLVRNGRWTELGVAKDLLWEGANEEVIALALSVQNGETLQKHQWSFALEETSLEFVRKSSSLTEMPKDIGIFTDKFQYLRAERWGPRVTLPISNSQVRVKRQLGRDGEFTSFFLATFGEEEVTNAAVHHPSAHSKKLLSQVEAWLGEISPGTRLYTNAHDDLDLVSIQYAFTGGSGETNHYRATNVGFGISYVLPIIVAALSSSPGSMLLVENPEAHLHPRGQRRMAELLAKASLGGVQIVIETHSDHLLNGLRLSVHSGEVDPSQIALHFFEREQTAHAIRAKITSPEMDSAGRLSYWPDGFFDENAKALRSLLLPPTKK
jgi:predicted ATPase